MIAFIDDLPLVEFENGHVYTFRREWLQQHLIRAAEQAGYRNWWLADHVAQSVTNYLMTQYEANILSATELRSSVAEVLATIGYSEVAKHFSPTRPARDISLLEIANQSGEHELTFFSLLREAMMEELHDGVNNIYLIHLSPAAKKLLSVKLFTEDCAALRTEIVEHVRCFVASLNGVNIIIR
jgi:hypothetical protein